MIRGERESRWKKVIAMALPSKSLLARIVVYFFLLSSLIVFLLTAFSYFFFITGTEKRAMEQMTGLATIKANMLNSWVAERERDTVILAQLSDVVGAAKELSSVDALRSRYDAAYIGLHDFFIAQAANLPQLMEISILSAEGGRILFSTRSSLEGQYRVLDAFFIEGKKGTYIENVYPSPITLQPTLTISTPIRERDGRTVAVLAANLDLETMDTIIRDRTGLGKTGQAYLVDHYNVFVSSERFGSESYPRGVHSVGIDAAVTGKNGSGMYRDYAGMPVIGVYRWVSERDLALLVEIHQEEVFAPAQTQTIILVILGLGMVLAAAASIYLLARRIAAPILAVQQAALRVSQGELSAQAPVLTSDEIGELAKAFNLMAVKVRELYDELKRKEEHFRSLIESSSDIIAVLDERFRVVFVSPAVERVLGYSPEELVGTDPFRLLHPGDREWISAQVAHGLPSSESSPRPLVFRLAHKGGGWRVLEATGRNLLSHPAIAGIVIDARDVTERHQLEEKLSQAQKMEAVGRLAGGIAHDFNNLLTAVLGYSDVLLEESPLQSASREYVLEIRKAATRAASLTQQLLAYSRKQMLQPKTVDLNSLVSGMQNMLKRLIGEDIELSTRPAPDLLAVKADPNQIEQVIMNLAVNARDAMPQGGKIVFETCNVTLKADSFQQYPELAPGLYVVLSVSDTGIGMDAETRTRIFDPFFTTKGIGKGTGLGLSTAYGIVKQSGGHIGVSSEPGRGSTFTIYLPAAAGDPRPELESEPAQPDNLTGSETVLVVEDEESVRRMIEMVLGQSGYCVHSEANPSSAVRYAEMADHIDLVVTDVVLPGMNGRAMAEAILKSHPGVKVLFISGYTEDAIVQHGVVSEGISFLQKPFLPKMLAAKVRDILDDR
jgi:PAS domain S-box-containing protein